MNSKSLSVVCFLIATFLLASVAKAGRININTTNATVTGIGFDGSAALGGGYWNRINHLQAVGSNALVKSDNAFSGVVATATTAVGFSLANGNLVQSEYWSKAGPLTFTISNLLPNQVYKVAIYGSRTGTPTYNVNGVVKSLPNPGVAITPLPGTEDVDYATFVIDATAAGQIVIVVSGLVRLAGVQIDGLLDATESGPQMDCRIKKSGKGKAGKGNDRYGLNPSRSQSITQTTTGGRAKRYYVNIENDGDEIDNCYAMAFFRKKQARIKVIDRDGGGNVTAAVKNRNYRYDLGKDDTRRFKVVVRPKSRKRATINVQLCGSPSTLVSSKQDCSTCVLKIKN